MCNCPDRGFIVGIFNFGITVSIWLGLMLGWYN